MESRAVGETRRGCERGETPCVGRRALRAAAVDCNERRQQKRNPLHHRHKARICAWRYGAATTDSERLHSPYIRVLLCGLWGVTQIIFLYGRPGVGKLTVGEHLTSETGYNLLHNHAVVDLATSLFPFGTPAFIALREILWHTCVDAALRAKIGGVIMTFAPEATVTDNFIPSLQKRVTSAGGTLHLIELKCSSEELEKRIQ